MSGLTAQFGVVKEIGTPATITAIVATAGTPNIGTVAATAHAHRQGDVVTLAGFTPSGWNGTFTIVSVPDSSHYVISTGATSVANATVMGTETLVTKYGGGGTPSRFFEIPSGGDTMSNDRGRVQSSAAISGQYVDRADRFVVYPGGGGGDLVMEVLSKGFAYWMSVIGFAVTTTGPTDTAAYTHAGAIATTLGQSVQLQWGRPTSYEIVEPFSYPGAKAQSWELSNSAKGALMLKITFSFQNELVSVALASPSYPTGAEMITFVGGNITVGGVALATLKTITLSGNLGLTAVADRVFINNGGLPAEPLQNGKKQFKWSAAVEFTDMNAYNRWASATASGTMAALSAVWAGLILIPSCATTYPSLTIAAPNARHDSPMTPNVSGPALLTQTLSGPLLNTSGTSNDAVTWTYVSADTTP